MTTRTLLAALAGTALLRWPVPAGAQPVPPSTATYTETEGPPTPPPTAALQVPTAFDKLVSPIALYPDPLIAVLLPAATFPDQLQAANTYLVQYGDPSQLDRQPWDASVRALAHYPTVVAWMVENLSWTRALGAAFASSPGDVMDSVQKLRAIAEANGTLQATPQQSVVGDGDAIDILPAQADAIYVPAYDPDVVFADYSYSDYSGPFINFGDPCPVGIWLDFGFDWRNHRVWTGNPGLWRDRSGWRVPSYPGRGAPTGTRAWQSPGTASVLGGGPAARPAGTPVPRPMETVPNPPPEHYRNPSRGPGETPGPGEANPGRPGVTPQPRPHLAPPEHSPLPGVDYIPPSRAPEVHTAPGSGERAPRPEPAAPREPAERGTYELPVRAEPPAPHEAPRSEPAERPAPAPHESSAPREAPESRDPRH